MFLGVRLNEKMGRLFNINLEKMMNQVHSILAFLLYLIGAFDLFRLLYLKNKITIVFYHEVSSKMILDKPSLFITKSNFEKQLKFLSRKFNIISIDDLIAFYLKKSKIPKYPLIITFDGGYEGNLQNAYPILKKYNAKSTIYLITGCMDRERVHWLHALYYLFEKTAVSEAKIRFEDFDGTFKLSNVTEKKQAVSRIKQYLLKNFDKSEEMLSALSKKLNVSLSDCYREIKPLTWRDIRANMQDDLITFGAHTVNHLRLTYIDLKMAEFEIKKCKEIIENNLNIVVRSFCYPDGYLSDEIKTIVSNSGYSLAISGKEGFNDIKNLDIYELKRIGMKNEKRTFMFVSWLYGFSTLFYKTIYKVRKFFEN